MTISSPLRSVAMLFVGPLSISLLLAATAKANAHADLTSAAKDVSSARDVLADLVIDFEERELDALLGSGTLVRLNSDAGDIAAALSANASNSDVRLGRVEDAFAFFARTYRDAVSRYDDELADRCFDGTFALKVGDSLDAAGEAVWTASRALGFRVKLPHPARLEDVCGEIDGK
jgi:hypothetical protein